MPAGPEGSPDLHVLLSRPPQTSVTHEVLWLAHSIIPVPEIRCKHLSAEMIIPGHSQTLQRIGLPRRWGAVAPLVGSISHELCRPLLGHDKVLRGLLRLSDGLDIHARSLGLPTTP